MAVATAKRLTPIQKKMLAVLADGELHTREELHACLNDNLSPHKNIWFHLTNIRKVVRPKGQEIICQFVNRRRYLRLVRLIGRPKTLGS